MGVVAGPTAVESEVGKPDWSPIPPRPGRSPRAAAVRRVLGAAAAAVLVWWLAHPALAVGIVVVMLVVTLACELSPRFARKLQHLEERFQHWVGAVLSLLLMGLLQYVVFAPIWFLLKLFRRNPLDVGAREQEGSAWSPAPRRAKGRPLYKRSFAYERVGGAASRGLRVRAAVGVVALLVALDIGVGALLGNGGAERNTADADTNLLGAPDAAAGRSEPWRVPLGEELDRVWTGKRYDPYLGWTLPDFHGRYVTVSDGVRESRQTTGGRGRPVEIFFFGGSSMFGLFQRDGHTIPSEFSRLAERDGLHLRIVNYGRLAYVNWQEHLLMDQLASGGKVPDLAVFYDGFNEVVTQFQLGLHRRPTQVGAGAIADRLEDPDENAAEKSALDRLSDAWGDVSAVRQAARDLGIGAGSGGPVGLAALTPAWPGDQGDRPRRRGRYAEEIYARGVDLIRRGAASYGFAARFFWQPSIYSKRVEPDEEPLETWLGADAAAWRAATSEARSRLGPSVTDLGTVLDPARTPVMYDFVHTNERGARLAAAGLYERLRPDLLRLADGNSP